jgi:hypothetical protein
LIPLNETTTFLPGTKNLTILGQGTRWRMQKADYMNPKLYAHSEDRAGLSLIGCDGCRVQDVTISDTGGDGVSDLVPTVPAGVHVSYTRTLT